MTSECAERLLPVGWESAELKLGKEPSTCVRATTLRSTWNRRARH